MFKKCKTNPSNTPTSAINIAATLQWMLSAQKKLGAGLSVALVAGCGQIPVQVEPFQAATKADTSIPPVVDVTLPNPTQQLDCANIQPEQKIVIKGHSKLSPSCDLTGKGVQFILDSANTSLDCNGAQLSSGDPSTNKTAITIRPKADRAITNITVANCHVTGYGHALNIRQFSNPNVRYRQGLTDPEANRNLAPHHIRVVNVSSNGSTNSGIFVGDHVHDVRFDRLQIMRSGTVGLYLEFGSRHNSIENSVFVDNGYRTFKPNREAIAVDSSAFNTIKNNQFIHNGAGAIHLYRNCFEHANDPSRSNHFKRTQSAQDNIIEGNTFRDEPVGVWVASRQSRNLKGFECGAYPLAQTAFASYHLDSAKNNKIIGNRFVNVDTGIIVEDDGTQIIANDFSQSGGTPVIVGSEIREKYGNKSNGISAELKNTRIDQNKFAPNQPITNQLQISAVNKATTVVKD